MKLLLLLPSLFLLHCFFCTDAVTGQLLKRFGFPHFNLGLNETLRGGLRSFGDFLKDFDLMKSSKVCIPVPLAAGFTLKLLKLYFFFGSGESDHYSVPISNAKDLMHHNRWREDLPIALYTFGWLHRPTNSFTRELVKAYDANGKFNFVVVDWHLISHFEYGMAVTMAPRVGRKVAEGLQDLLDAGANLGHIVGHSLGAQITGHIARNLRERPRLVIGLDPAGPLFYDGMHKCQDALSSTDGEQVIAVHTDWGILGANAFTGPVDFMPNNGRRIQPGCNSLDFDSFGPLCSHTHAIFFWCDAVRNFQSMIGRQCSSWEEFENKACSENDLLRIGEPTKKTGVFYLKTNHQYPFGLGRSGA